MLSKKNFNNINTLNKFGLHTRDQTLYVHTNLCAFSSPLPSGKRHLSGTKNPDKAFDSQPSVSLKSIARKQKTSGAKLRPKKRNKSFQQLGGEQIRGTIKTNLSLMSAVFAKLDLPVDDYFAKSILAHNKLIANHGVKFGTKLWKDTCLYATLLIEGRQAEAKLPDMLGCGRKDRWPNLLTHLRPLYHRIKDVTKTKELRAQYLQLFNTLIKINKCVEEFTEIDTSDLTQTFDIPEETLRSYSTYVELRLRKSGDFGVNPTKLRVFPYTTPSNGPNRAPACITADMEAYKLRLEPVLYKAFKGLCEITGNSDFLEYFHSRADIYQSELNRIRPKMINLRKLQSVADAGNKSRTVAIVDYWTQTLLNALESEEKEMLEREFKYYSAYRSHSGGFNKIKPSLKAGWLSIDATAWTDNFPSTLQHIYLKNRYSEEFANHWLNLAVSCSWKVGDRAETVTYGKGQGMGTKGSFIIATLSDHYFIEKTLFEEYRKINPYMKVGDDLIVYDPKETMISSYPKIGVPVNQSKTKRHTCEGMFSEFVSRNTWDDYDVSPVSAKLIGKAYKQPYYIPILIKHLKERFSVSDETVLSIFEKSKIKDKTKLYEITYLFQQLTGEEIFQNLPPDVQFTPQEVVQILKHLLMKSEKEITAKLSRSQIISPETAFDHIKYEQMQIDFMIGDYFDREYSFYKNQKMKAEEIISWKYYFQLIATELSDARNRELPLQVPQRPLDLLDKDGNIILDNVRKIMNLISEGVAWYTRLKVMKGYELTDERNLDIVPELFKSINRALSSYRSGTKVTVPEGLRAIPSVRIILESEQEVIPAISLESEPTTDLSS